jgi:hypothetical protein
MDRRTSLFPALALAIAGLSPVRVPALEAQADLETCRHWHQRIEHYTRLRRAGEPDDCTAQR